MSENVMVLAGERITRRQQIEIRIGAYRDNATSSLLEIGRQLNLAKDEGLVPHGEWGAWVAEHAMMSERTAQAWMQAARELPPGSPLERLGIAKIRSLLTLPSGEREEAAAKIGAAEISSREVEEKVRAIRAERDEALRVLGEQKKRMQDMAREQGELIDAAKRRAKDESAYEIRVLESRVRTETAGRKQTELALDRAREQLTDAKGEAAKLRQALEETSSKPDPEQTQRIALLENQLKARDAAIAQREQEIDRLSEQLDEAQVAAMRGGMTGGERPNPVSMILSAIGALMAQAGRSPGELARMMGTIDEETRSILAGQARMTGQWAAQILAACGEAIDYV